HWDTTAPALGLAIPPEARGSVLRFLDFSARMAAFVQAFPLDDALEPAPVFVPRVEGE
ncbi:MAG: DUF4089 domain-containing protein, partial [Candidatus Competibacterales bacterium]